MKVELAIPAGRVTFDFPGQDAQHLVREAMLRFPTARVVAVNGHAVFGEATDGMGAVEDEAGFPGDIARLERELPPIEVLRSFVNAKCPRPERYGEPTGETP
ncbi:MAG: hypothetical protein AB7G11_11035 [Phycisphaerales bacterium]